MDTIPDRGLYGVGSSRLDVLASSTRRWSVRPDPGLSAPGWSTWRIEEITRDGQRRRPPRLANCRRSGAAMGSAAPRSLAGHRAFAPRAVDKATPRSSPRSAVPASWRREPRQLPDRARACYAVDAGYYFSASVMMSDGGFSVCPPPASASLPCIHAARPGAFSAKLFGRRGSPSKPPMRSWSAWYRDLVIHLPSTPTNRRPATWSWSSLKTLRTW